MISDATKSVSKVCIKAVQNVKKKGKAFCLFRQAKTSRIEGGGKGVKTFVKILWKRVIEHVVLSQYSISEIL